MTQPQHWTRFDFASQLVLPSKKKCTVATHKQETGSEYESDTQRDVLRENCTGLNNENDGDVVVVSFMKLIQQQHNYHACLNKLILVYFNIKYFAFKYKINK